MNVHFRRSACAPMLLALAVAVSGCATPRKPPTISLDEPVQAQPLPELPKPVEVVAVPEPLPLPGQLMPLPVQDETPP
ncbi:MAG TPA: P-type conjugative transfer protein TrbG, partial [Pseudoxanthomonas mexicana]|nr:P-type conjugative transfer protein TrbG [Pseudoxanthomonas mexicana]